MDVGDVGSSTEEEIMDRCYSGWRVTEQKAMEAAAEARKTGMKALYRKAFMGEGKGQAKKAIQEEYAMMQKAMQIQKASGEAGYEGGAATAASPEPNVGVWCMSSSLEEEIMDRCHPGWRATEQKAMEAASISPQEGNDCDEVLEFIAKRARRFPLADGDEGSAAAEAPHESNVGNEGKEGDGSSSSSTFTETPL